MLDFDEAAARRVERTYATPDVAAQRVEVLRQLALQGGERVLDVGSGPGYLAALMGDAVGSAGLVHGIDGSGAMNSLARARCADRPWVTITAGDACALPYPDGSFDVAVSTEVSEYVGDMRKALSELHRVLHISGRILILDTDWDSVVWQVTDRIRHARIMAAWDDHLAHPHLPRTLSTLLREAGFRITDRRVIPLFNPDYDPNTYSVLMTPLIATFTAGRRGVTAADVEAWAADLRAHGEAGDYFFSINRYCFLALKEEIPR